jgi:hypothetical protein
VCISSGRNPVGQRPTERTSDNIVQTVPSESLTHLNCLNDQSFSRACYSRRINPPPSGALPYLAKHPELFPTTAVTIFSQQVFLGVDLSTHKHKHTHCGLVLINENVDENSHNHGSRATCGEPQAGLGWLCPPHF